jgi:hypothetical protein
MSEPRNIITIDDSPSDRAVYITVGNYMDNSALTIGENSKYGTKDGASYLSLYTNEPYGILLATHEVYVNGNNVLSIPFISTINKSTAMIVIRLVLQEPINDIVIYGSNSSNKYLETGNTVRIRALVIKDASPDTLTITDSFYCGGDITRFPGGVKAYSTRELIISALSTVQTDGRGLFGGTITLPTPSVPLTFIPSFPSYIDSGSSASLQYTDEYGRLIVVNGSSYPNVPHLAGGLAETLNASINSPVYYGKLQGYWQGNGDPNVLWDSEGYIKSSVQGTYTIYPLTTKGYVALTVVVLPPQPSERSYYGFENCEIDVSTLPGFTNTTSITVDKPGVDITNGKITLPSYSVKFTAGLYVFNLNVLPTPAIQEISAAVEFSYNLADLVGLNENIPLEAYTAVDGSDANTIANNGIMKWGTQSSNPSASTVSVYNKKVANITLKTIDYIPSTIFAPQSRRINLFSFFKTTSPNDRLIEVYNDQSDEIISAADGTLCFGKTSVTSLHCKVCLAGVELVYNDSIQLSQPSIPVIVIDGDATTYYVTQGTEVDIPVPNGNELRLMTDTGEQIKVTNSLATREIKVSTSTSGGNVVYSIEPLRECLLLRGDDSSEIHLVPFQSLQDTNIPILCVKDKSGNVTISMPHGPTYSISSVPSGGSPIATFDGGSTMFHVSSNTSKLYMSMPNYLTKRSASSPDYYTINIIEGTKVVFGLVNKRTIVNATSDNLPSFITRSANDLVVTRSPGVDMSDTFVAETDGKYVQYVFKILPPIKLKQTLFYTNDMKYTDILPMGDYIYQSDLDMSIKPSSGSTTVSVNFNYGEFQGVFTLVLYDKKITIKEIYKSALVVGTTMHTVSGDAIDILSGSYNNAGVTFTGLPEGGPITTIRIDLSQPDLNVGEYFIVDSGGNSKLYDFRNVPALSHPDVFLFSATSWKADVPVKLDSMSYSVGQLVPINGEVTVELDYDSTSPYYEAGVSFNIIDVNGVTNKYSLCQNWEGQLPDEIDSYMINPPARVKYGGSATYDTSLLKVKMCNNDITVEANPVAKTTSGTLYVTTYHTDSGKRVTETHILELTVYPKPFNDIENLQYYNGDLPAQPEYTGEGTISDVVIEYVSSPGATPVPATSLAVGKNRITYSFTPPGGDKETGFTSTFNIKVIPKPSNVNLNRLLKVGETLEDDIILTQFGSSNDYTITSVSIDGTDVISSVPSSGSHNGLTLSINSAQHIVFTSSQDGATTPGSPSPLPDGHQVVIVLDYYPSGASHKTTVTMTLSVFVWDPTNVQQVLARATVDTKGTRRSKANSTAITPPTPSKLISINRDGQTLTGTSDDVLDWSEYPSKIYLFSTSIVVRNYFIFSDKGATLFTVLIMPDTIAPAIVKFPSASSRVIDLLEQFFPDQETSLLNAGATLGQVDNLPTTGSSLIAFQAIYKDGNIATTVQIMIGSVTIATVSYVCALVKEPTLVVQSPEFVIPLNQSYTVLSEMVSLDSQLSSSDPQVRNSSTGITVSFSTIGSHPVPCTLTNQGVTTLPISITFVVFDPKDTQDIQQTSWSGFFNPIFASTVASASIASYSIDGTNYGTTTSQYVTSVSGLQLNVRLTESQPIIVITVKLTDGNVGIFKGTYLIVSGGTQKQYLIEGANAQTQFTYDQLSDVPSSTPGTTIMYEPPAGSTPTAQGYAVCGPDLSTVGYITAPGGSSVFLYPSQPGVWDLTGLKVRIGSVTKPINPYVETLAQIVTQPAPILTTVGTSLNYDLNNFVVSGVGQVIFTNWQFSNDGATFSSTLPSWLVISLGNLRSTTFTSVGSYSLKCMVQSSKYPSMSSSLSFDIVVSDPNDETILDVLLVSNLESTLALDSPVVSINGTAVSTSTYTIDSVKLVFGQGIITFSTRSVLSKSVTLSVVTKNGKTNFIAITQVPNEKNINIVAFGYKGQLFKTTTGSIVQSYTASGPSVPSNQLTSVFQPNMDQTIGTASVVINTDGTFAILNAQSLTLSVTYTISNTTQIISITVGTDKHPLVTIEQSPPPIVSLGKNVTRVLVAEGDLSDGNSLDLGYAIFKLNGDNLEISNVTPMFQPTLVQAENVLSSKINVVSMLIDIKRDVPVQPIYAIPLNSTVQHVLPFEPSCLTYNSMSLSGPNQSVKLYTDSGNQFAEVMLSGSALIITSSDIAAFSKPIGFRNKNSGYMYIIVRTFVHTSSAQDLSVGSVVHPPSDLTFQTIGTLDGENIATPGQTLANMIHLVTTSFRVLPTSLTSSFSFYATLSDGSVNYYTLRFVKQQINVSNLKLIPLISFVGAAQGTVAFSQEGIIVVGNMVKNPNSLRVLTMTSPFYGQFTINLLS